MQKIEKNDQSKTLENTDLVSNAKLSELNAEFEKIFKNASKTYFYSSLFFPKKIREQINILYAFVRTADDFVDSIPANPDGFFAFKNYYLQNSKIQLKDSQISNPQNSKFKIYSKNENKQNLENQSNLQKLPTSSNLQPKSDINLKTSLDKKINLKNEENKINTTKNLEFTNQKLEFWQKIILAFVDLEEKLEFEKSWTLAFLESMENDLSAQIYPTIGETCKYIYGSANVIGFFMVKILNLPQESYQYAAFLGQSFQYINFIRDIAEDLELKRCYFPQNLLQECNLQSLKYEETSQKTEEFQKFVRICLGQYENWQLEAEKGFKFFPKKYKIAIKTASDMYRWTAKTIAKDPFIVYQKKIKPQKRRVLLTGIVNWLTL